MKFSSTILYIIIVLSSSLIFPACDSDSEKENTPLNVIDPDKEAVILMLDRLGLNPKDRESITSITHYIEPDEEGVSVLLGNKNEMIWIATFDKKGDEINSFESNELNNGSLDTPPVVINNRMITNYLNVTSSKIFVLDLNTCNEVNIHQIQTPSKRYRYYKENDFIFAQKESDHGYDEFMTLNSKGEMIWSRATGSSENMWGIGSYSLYKFISPEELMFETDKHDGDNTTQVYRVINLKTYQLLFDISKRDINITGENAGLDGVQYRIDKVQIHNNNIRMQYTEYRQVKVILDEILGTHEWELEILGTYYYDIDRNGQIIGQGKL